VPRIVPNPCPACGKFQGSNADCLSCRDAAARELAKDARDVTWESLPARNDRVLRFLEKPPWYAAAAPKGLLARLRLFWMLATDFLSGRYGDTPWRVIASLAAAVAYVLTPADLVPDLFGPIGFADDLLVVAVAWRLARAELRRYCEWKGLSPAHFGLEEPSQG
jgi:uncharacterized membrane protein YkvA (DUF1232 family)